ncbi:GntR family transcriptional regulator [Nocardiopsis sp. MG754419]|uniref:GntR family transcriptional regulator n=1 Tax=Nocardiopsis sp. MG754419 TaxID=2259865 RepID=UPI001BAC959E|nr:GntR family transcriptional regulator [Nocardiopsis sp. MG754419]
MDQGLPHRAPSLTEQVMDRVRQAVVDQTMRPGELYSVQRLAEEMGISRSPVRDALVRLEEAGLLAFERNRGFRVLPTEPEDVAEIFSIRLALEVPAVARAARDADAEALAGIAAVEEAMHAAATEGDETLFFDHDERLHDMIMRAGRADRSAQIVARLRIHTRLLGASTAGDARTLDDIDAEHAPVLAALRDRNPAAAREAMERHLRSTGRLLVEQACRRQGRAPEEAGRIWARFEVEGPAS